MSPDRKPLVAHVLYRLDTGGAERTLVIVINQTGARYRHAVVCLDDFTAFRDTITDPDVTCIALHKKPGKDFGCYARLWTTLRELKPDLVQTWNYGALDMAPVAKAAGVRGIVHAERGREAGDPDGQNRKYRALRRWMAPFVDRYLAVSRDLQDWLVDKVGIAPEKVVYLPNGIDTTDFAASGESRNARPLLGEFAPPGTILIGNVGRLDPVKDQLGLLSAFHLLCQSLPDVRDRLRLVIVGKGPQRPALEARIAELGLGKQVLLLGNRDDVPALLAECNLFVLSSIAEGMPGAVLEAMAAGLPVVATDVGGTGELVVPGETGALVPASDPAALCGALARYVSDAGLRSRHGDAGRRRAESEFSLRSMVSGYIALYDGVLQRHARAAQPRVTTSPTNGGGD